MASSDREFFPDSNPSDGGNLLSTSETLLWPRFPEQERERSGSPVVRRELDALGIPKFDCLDQYPPYPYLHTPKGQPIPDVPDLHKKSSKTDETEENVWEEKFSDPFHFPNQSRENGIRDPFYFPEQRNGDPFQANQRNENVWEEKFSDPFHFSHEGNEGAVQPDQRNGDPFQANQRNENVWEEKFSDPFHFSQEGNEGAVHPDQGNENVKAYGGIHESYWREPVGNNSENLTEIKGDSSVPDSLENNNEHSQLLSTNNSKNLSEIKGHKRYLEPVTPGKVPLSKLSGFSHFPGLRKVSAIPHRPASERSKASAILDWSTCIQSKSQDNRKDQRRR